MTTLAFWWILTALLYIILFLVFVRYGKWERTGPKFLFATICVLILLIPFMNPPISYFAAVFIVIDLLILVRVNFKPEISSRSEDR